MRDTERYVKSSFLGWKSTNLGRRGREKEKQKERDREIRQIKLFGVERHQIGTGTKGERERERERQRDTSNQAFWGRKTPIWDREEGRERERHIEIRQTKLFGVERHQFGTERKGERERERHREILQTKLFGVERQQFGTERKGARERETQRDTSNQAFWGGKRPIWERERERDRQRWLREKTLGLLRSLGFLHFFLYFPNFSIFFLYLGMVTGDGYGRRLWAYYVVLVFFISSCIFFICLEFGDGYGSWLREKALGLLRSLGFLNFFMYFLHFSSSWGCLQEMVTGEDFERERESKRDRERYVKSGFLGWKKPIWDRERESKRGRERERDTSNQAFWGGKTPIWDREEGREREKERHREIRQIKLFGMERHQFGTGTKGERERERDTERYVKSSFLGWRDSNLGQRGRERERHKEIRQIKLFGVEKADLGQRAREKERERERDTSNQAFWGGKTPIWDREERREREREREKERHVKSSFLGWNDTNLGQGRREREKEKERDREIRQIKLFGAEKCQFRTERKGEREREREKERDTERYVKSSFLG